MSARIVSSAAHSFAFSSSALPNAAWQQSHVRVHRLLLFISLYFYHGIKVQFISDTTSGESPAPQRIRQNIVVERKARECRSV